MPRWQNRIVAFGTVAPEQLLANPFNYRHHPGFQRDALRGSLDDLDIITPVVVNRTTGHLIDGHARVEEFISHGVDEVPVAYVELTQEQEKRALLMLDPIAALAIPNETALVDLLGDVDIDNEALQRMLDDLLAESSAYSPTMFPEIGSGDVDEDALARAQRELDERGQVDGADRQEIICPHCMGRFHVDA